MSAVDPQSQDQAVDINQAGPTIEISRARPDAHTQRYDRQLRLWAASGQISLEESNVLLIGSSYLGACILKNLILPGIGRFTIMDNAIVGPHDLGVNFFLDSESLGKSRAAEVTRLVGELNPSVVGTSKVQSPSQVLANDLDFLANFTLVICVNQAAHVLAAISEYCWKGSSVGGAPIGIPLMAVRGAGLIGQCEIQVQELGIIDTHPATLVSLRLLQPFSALKTFIESFDLSATALAKMDSMERAHVPYLVLIGKALQEWSRTHDNQMPGSDTSQTWAQRSEEKKAFRSVLRLMQANFRSASRDGEVPDSENFDEAEEALGVHVFGDRAAAKPSSTLQALLDSEQCVNPSQRSQTFWLLLAALRGFLEATPSSSPPGSSGVLPLSGALPDFKALTATYVDLQKIYRTKAAEDFNALRAHLHLVLAKANIPTEAVNDTVLAEFVKNAEFVHLLRGKKLVGIPRASSIVAGIGAMSPPGPTVQHHLVFTAADEFFKEHGRYPGISSELTAIVHGQYVAYEAKDAGFAFHEEDLDVVKDAAELAARAMELARQAGVADNEDDDDDGEGGEGSVEDRIKESADEFVRSGHSDLPSTAALLGGVAAQEAIKLITRQYIPLNNTAIYDGIRGTIGAFQL